MQAMGSLHRLFVTLITVSLLAACAPQAALVGIRSDLNQVRTDTETAQEGVRDNRHRIDVLNENIKGTLDAQKVMADYGAKSDQLQTDINLLQGKLEENNFRIADLAQKLDDRSVKLAELSSRIDALEARLKALTAGTPTSAPTATGGGPAQPKTVEPSAAYRQAKRDYDKGNFELARAGFENYLKQFPGSSLADAAQYWTGECYYSQHEYSKAIEAFTQVLKNYPKSEKAPGAQLKIGLSYLNKKNIAKAKHYLRLVVKEHPHTNEAAIAKARLKKLGK